MAVTRAAARNDARAAVEQTHGHGTAAGLPAFAFCRLTEGGAPGYPCGSTSGEGAHVAETRYDVVGIGNALVDVLAHVDGDFIRGHGLQKNAMTLIDGDQADRLYADMPPGVEISGGSAGNTVAGIAMLGGRAAYIAKVADDELGRVFRHDIRAAGVAFDVTPYAGEVGTGRCLILVTPDAERTMQTFLGAGAELQPDDVDETLIRASSVTFLEGYLWDPEGAKQAFLKAARLAHDAGRRVSFTLSDPFCVERHREEFRDLVEHHVDILFANEREIMSLYETEDFDDALQRVRRHCEVAALTRSERGSVIVAGHEVHVVDAEAVERVVDTTGAGDLYAAGFLFGYTQGMDARRCGRLGGIAAAEIISHVGARFETPPTAAASAVMA
ncbi:MAG: adenosine kinase [Chloroflexi bacterium]|nr:adenosine kinase [Chloroflexota bacterium]